MYILDTNVVSELRKSKSGKANQNVTAWAQGVASSNLYLSVITILELEIGTLIVERRDPVQGSLLRTWLDKHVIPAFTNRIFSIDNAVVLRCARLHVPSPRADRDALIAATALVHGMTVVTRNLTDFEPMGVQTYDPWS